MSVFMNIVRYEGRSRIKLKPISETELNAAVKQLPGFSIVSEDGTVGVVLPRVHNVPELNRSGAISCRIDEATNLALLDDALCRLAAQIPGAVVEDEAGNVY